MSDILLSSNMRIIGHKRGHKDVLEEVFSADRKDRQR